MASNGNGSGGAAKWMVWIWSALLLLILGALASQMAALGATNERVARLEAQYDYVIKSLDRIERAVNPNRRSEGD